MKMKDKNFPPAASTLVIFLALAFVIPFSTQAQSPIVSSRIINVDEAVNTGISNNPAVQSATYSVEQQAALKKTSLDLGRTTISMNYGQYNSFYKDNNIGISQSFAFPTVYRNFSQLSKEHIAGAEFNAALTRNELKRNIKFSYYLLLVVNEKKKLFMYQDSIYSNFSKAAELRFKTGETSYLEKITAETRLMEIQNQLVQIEADIAIYTNQLQKLLNTKEDISVSNAVPLINSFTMAADSASIEKNPGLNLYRQQIAINHAQAKLEKSRLLPGFSLGYFNQSLQGNYVINGKERFAGTGTRFQYVYAGVDIPLWARPQTARIKAANLGEKIASSNYEMQKLRYESELETLMKEYKKDKNSINYYQQKALSNADLILDNSSRAFKAGEIGYIEFVQGISQAVQIKLNYLNAINQFNQTTINLEYILGGIQ
jgi:cobalt-zinc-cadmium resistance protein CzcA